MESFKRWADNFFTRDNFIDLVVMLVGGTAAMTVFYGMLYVADISTN
tara:strand:- start:368 stop:508 length:141 start_codon:yes stop_codon:yes gene_type:complete